MQGKVLLLSSIMIMAAFAGCANTSGADDPPMSTPTGSTTPPTTTPTPTPTPTPTSPAPTPPACPAAVPGAPATGTELVYTVSEPTESNPCYGLHGPSAGPSGWVKVTLQNGGFEPHQVNLVQLGDMSYDDFVATARGEMPSEMGMHSEGSPVRLGGPQAAGGGNTTVLVDLAPGSYAVICYIPSPNGMSHAMQGMVAPLTILATPTNETEPEPTLTLDLQDYSFAWSENLTAGAHVIRINNSGAHPHEAVLVKLTGNATSADFMAAFEPGATAPPPIEMMSGISGMSSGLHTYLWIDVTPGNWALLCFEQDSPQDPPHFVKGMILDWTIA